MGYDFFTPQPIKEAQVYFFRRVFMDWEDDRAEQILKSVQPAMSTKSVLLIQDACTPEPHTCPLWQERRYRASGILRLAIANGQNREVEDWQGLIKDSDWGLACEATTRVGNSEVLFIEAKLRGRA